MGCEEQPLTRAAAAVVVAVVLVACGGAPAPATTTPPPSRPATSPVACAVQPSAAGPDAAVSLGEKDSGSTVCLHIGAKLSVFLSVPPERADVDRWTAIHNTDSTILQPVPNGELTLVRGVTAAFYAAARAGVSRLSSTRPPCPATAAPGCPPAAHWEVTVVVEA